MLKNKQIAGLGGAALLDAGTGAGELVQLDSLGRLPAVNGSQLTGLSGGGGGGAESSVPLSTVTNVPGTGDYTISGTSASNSVYFVDTASATGNLSIYLPLASDFSAGEYLLIARTTGSVTLNIRVSSGSSDTVRGSSSFSATPGQSWLLMSDGSSKWITLEMGYV